MKNQLNDIQDKNSPTALHSKNEIGLPLIALCLDLAPVLLAFLGVFGRVAMLFALLSMVLLPIAGVIVGIVALSRGKGRIGIVGKILAIIAIALPLSVVAFIIIFFIGAATGVISLM